jgi:tetratricopeptide (TPR) repeat protein
MEHYKEFSFAGWIDYVSSIKESLVNSINTGLVKGHEKDNLDERFNKIITFLQHLPPDSLLVIDNIENPDDEDLDKIKTLPFKVIANSRLNIDGFDNHTLEFLSAESCKALFYERYKGERHDEFVEKIVERCGRHTLTVELLARTAQNAALPVKKLYDQLVEKGFNLNGVIGEKVGTFWHNEKTKKQFFHHLLTVFELSNVSDSELFVLTNLSVLPAIYVSKEKIKKWMELKTMDDMNSLVHKGWLKQERFNIFMHQVIQEVIRHRTSPDVRKCKNLIVSLAKKLHLEQVENPIDKKEFIPFADSLLSYIEEKDEELAGLSNNLSLRYKDLGQLGKTLEFQLKTSKIFEAVMDKNHPSLAVSYSNLSLTYLDLGQPEKALESQERALKIREQVLDKNHPDLATSYNNLSLIYQNLGQLEKALEFQMKSLEILEIVLDENHPTLAASYNNLSSIYRDLGQLENALDFQKKALKIREQILDKNHPDLANSYNNLSTIYYEKKDYLSALRFSEKAVAIFQRLFPNGHPKLDIFKKNREKIKGEMKP